MHVVDGAWSSVVAFIVSKVHIFIFSQYLNLYYIYRRQSNYSVAESVFINTHNQVQEKLRAWELETNSSVLCFRSLLCFQWDDLEEAVVYLGVGCRGCWLCRSTQVWCFLHRFLLPVSRIVANCSVRMKLSVWGKQAATVGRVFQRGFFLVFCLHSKLLESNG